jgi:hypothetical protein
LDFLHQQSSTHSHSTRHAFLLNAFANTVCPQAPPLHTPAFCCPPSGEHDDKTSLQEQVAKAAAVISSLTSSLPASADDADAAAAAAAAAAAGGGALLRGPALAHVELAKRQLQLGLADEQQLVEALLLYHDRWVRREHIAVLSSQAVL